MNQEAVNENKRVIRNLCIKHLGENGAGQPKTTEGMAGHITSATIVPGSLVEDLNAFADSAWSSGATSSAMTAVNGWNNATWWERTKALFTGRIDGAIRAGNARNPLSANTLNDVSRCAGESCLDTKGTDESSYESLKRRLTSDLERREELVLAKETD